MSTIAFRGADGCELYASSFGAGPPVVLMHGGGPDHRSLVPLARLLCDDHTVLLPDVRGYGRSICRDPAQHTWSRYGSDVVALLDHLGHPDAVVGGTGMGGTIAMRMCVDAPSRVRAAVLISVEDIEDDEAKAAETALMDEFARRVRSDGVEAGWALFLPHLQPLIGTLVREAIPDADRESVAAAAAIGRDRAFRHVSEMAAAGQPVLVVPGDDARHPGALAAELVRLLPRGELAPVGISEELRTADDLAAAVAPSIRDFLARL